MARLGFVAGLVTASLVALPALADVPPPAGYVEQCTLAKKQTATNDCLECAGMHGQTLRCRNLLAPYCYQYVCQTYGASGWTEVLCRAKDANAPAVPAEVSAALPSPPMSAPSETSVVPIPATCAPYLPSDQKDEGSKSSGCSLPSQRSPLRELGPALILLGVLAVVLRHRRR